MTRRTASTQRALLAVGANAATGLDAYQRCIDLRPGHEGCRQGLALVQAPLGRLEASSRNLEEIDPSWWDVPGHLPLLASNYRALDQAGKVPGDCPSVLREEPRERHRAQGRVRGAARPAGITATPPTNAAQRGPGLDEHRPRSARRSRCHCRRTGTARGRWPRARGRHRRPAAVSRRNGTGRQHLFMGQAAEARQWAERAAVVRPPRSHT